MSPPPLRNRLAVARAAAVVCLPLLAAGSATTTVPTASGPYQADASGRVDRAVLVEDRAHAARASTEGSRVRHATGARGRGNPRAFAFLARYGSEVARWNPCARVGYRVNARRGGRGALADVREALSRIRRVAGLRFVFRGRTRIVPGGRGDRRYQRDTDLVIAWARPAQSEHLRGPSVAGVGGASWTYWREEATTRAMIVRGYAVLNANLPLARGFGGGVHNGYHGTRGQLLMHEIGHALGLDHPRQDDRWQIMYPVMTDKRAVWGAGDRRGLRRVGAGQGCLDAPYAGVRSTRATSVTDRH